MVFCGKHVIAHIKYTKQSCSVKSAQARNEGCERWRILVWSTFPTYLREGILSQDDETVIAWKTNPESHRGQPLHYSHNERGVDGITTPLPPHLPLLIVKLSIGII